MGATTYIQAVLALILVVGIILALAWLLRRYGLGEGPHGPLGRKKRIATIESTTVDSRHRLVLVRRDETEHLILVGPGDSFVVERGIVPQDNSQHGEPSKQLKT